MPKKLNLFGASGHAKVIIDILHSIDIDIDHIFDDNEKIKELADYRIISSYTEAMLRSSPVLISIGDNRTRKKISEKLLFDPCDAIVHRSSIISSSRKIDVGTVIMPKVVINHSSQIGKHCIINTSAVIEHDCTIRDFVHVSPSATLCGNVSVGEASHIGAGATIIQGVKIGKNTVIGAGSVVINDIPDNSTAVGVPAKVIRTKP